jgi:hypothetical protein
VAKVKPNKVDSLFSKHIRSRDGWMCQRCGGEYVPPTRALHCSHYYKRGIHATRFNEDNCIALCYGCHIRLEGDKQGEYKVLMLERLGEDKLNALERLAKTTIKRRIAEEEALAWLEEA